jgi:hypothetical protein
MTKRDIQFIADTINLIGVDRANGVIRDYVTGLFASELFKSKPGFDMQQFRIAVANSESRTKGKPCDRG